MRKSCRMAVRLMAAADFTMVPTRSWAGITGTAHDLSNAGYGSTQICIFCHTPHNAKSGTADNASLAPLWNHKSTTTTYTLYSSSTMDVPVGQPGNASKTCLSCHDGTVAIDAYGQNAGSHSMPGVPGTPGSANLGTNLSDDHPIGIRWSHQNQPSSSCVNCHGSMHLPFVRVIPFYNRKVECSSCHNAHSNDLTKFLRKTVTGSAICLHCHNK